MKIIYIIILVRISYTIYISLYRIFMKLEYQLIHIKRKHKETEIIIIKQLLFW